MIQPKIYDIHDKLCSRCLPSNLSHLLTFIFVYLWKVTFKDCDYSNSVSHDLEETNNWLVQGEPPAVCNMPTSAQTDLWSC